MQNKRAAGNLDLSIDLFTQTKRLIEFLEYISRIPEYIQPSFLKRAIYRYECYWLPLATDHPHELLAPPLDIEWAWHCHLLCPKAYENDCKEIVGVTVNHTMFEASTFYEKQKQSKEYWIAKYGNNREFFTVDFRTPFDKMYHSKITYDILAAAKRQMDLFYQMSLPHHRDRKYLRKSLQRYKQFLYLKKKQPNKLLEPSYDIDLVWHAHQINPRIYKGDMMRIVGYFLNHGESVDYRTEEDRQNADRMSRETWKYFYNEIMPMRGALYRGNSPAGLLYKISPNEAYASCEQSVIITLENVSLTMPRTSRNIILSVSSFVDKKGIKSCFYTEGFGESHIGNNTLKGTGVCQFELDIKASNLFIVLQEQVGSACSSVIGSNVVNILPRIVHEGILRSGRRIKARIPLGTNIRINFQMFLETPKLGKAMMTIKQGKYKTSVIPANIRQLLGPVSSERLPPGIDDRCEVATHRLQNRFGYVEFTARIVHSQPLMMSVIHVFYQDKMSAIGQLIASDQLPLPTQVHKDEITIDPMKGERAILIKNSGGDWGILKGRWKGYKSRMRGTTQETNQPEYPGTLLLKFFKCSTGTSTTAELGYLRKDYMCCLESAQIDLMKGVLTIDPSGNEVAENIALAFSVSVLHVLCAPRPKGLNIGQQLTSPIHAESRQVTTIQSTDMIFIIAAGMLQKTPSNDYMHTCKRNHICVMCAGGCMMELKAGVSEDLIQEDTSKDICKRCCLIRRRY